MGHSALAFGYQRKKNRIIWKTRAKDTSTQFRFQYQLSTVHKTHKMTEMITTWSDSNQGHIPEQKMKMQSGKIVWHTNLASSCPWHNWQRCNVQIVLGCQKQVCTNLHLHRQYTHYIKKTKDNISLLTAWLHNTIINLCKLNWNSLTKELFAVESSFSWLAWPEHPTVCMKHVKIKRISYLRLWKLNCHCLQCLSAGWISFCASCVRQPIEEAVSVNTVFIF